MKKLIFIPALLAACCTVHAQSEILPAQRTEYIPQLLNDRPAGYLQEELTPAEETEYIAQFLNEPLFSMYDEAPAIRTVSPEVLVVVTDPLGNDNYSKVVIERQDGETLTASDPYHRIPSGVYLITGTSRNEYYNLTLVVN